MRHEVYFLEEFKRILAKLSAEERGRVEKIVDQIKVNPYVGKSLQIRTLREKRLEGKRIYWLVFDEINAALIVTMSDKKAQQTTINRILSLIDDYQRYAIQLKTEN